MALNLGGLFFTLDADTRGLMTAQRRIERFADQVRNAFRGVGRGTVDPQFAQQLARQERAVISAMERIKRAHSDVQRKIDEGIFTPRAAREAQVTLERLSIGYDNFTRKMAQPVALNTLDFGRRVQHMNSQIADATRNIQRLTAESRKGTDVLHGFGSAALLVQGHLGGMSTRFFALTTLIKDFGVGIALAAGVMTGLAAGFASLAVGTVKAGMALQQVEKQLNAVSGNAAVAQYHIKFVKDVAAQAGIAFDDTARGFARFLVSAQSAGLTLKETQESFRGIALAGATMQLSTEDMQGVFRALDQMMSKGTVQAEELRGQLGDRLPGAFIAAAAAMNVSTRELNKMLKAGDVVSAEFVPKFVKAYMTMVGIDPSAPIQTLRAELTRAANEWTYFLQAMDRALGVTKFLQGVVKGLVEGLQGLSANLTTIIPMIGALAGALIGLGAAMALNALLTYVSAWWNAVAVYSVATRSVQLLATAQTALNGAMLFFQNIPIVRILTMLAIAIAGAVAGYQLMNKMIVNNTQNVGQSLGFWEQYISQQKRAGAQIRSVTIDIINQARAMAMQQMNIVKNTRSQMNSAAAGNANVWDVLGAGAALRRGQMVSPSDMARKRAGGLASQLTEESNELDRMTRVLRGLGDVLKLPEAGGQGFEKMGDAAKGAKESVEGITNRIKDLIDAAKIAQQQLEAMTQPLKAGEDINERLARLGDIGEAMKIVNNLSAKELGSAAGLLGVPANVDAVTNAIANLKGETRRAEEAVQEFVNVLGDIQKGERELRSLGRQMDYLREAGSNPDMQQLQFLEELGKAQETLRKMSSTAEGMRGIQALVTYLHKLEVAGSNAAEMLANFNMKLENTKNQIQLLQEFNNKIRDLKDNIQHLGITIDAYQNIGGLDQMFGADIGSAFDRAIDRGRTVADMVRKWQEAKVPMAQINEQAERLLNLLRQLDEAKFVEGQLKQAAERTQGAFQAMAREGVTALRDILRGTESLGEGLQKLAERIMDIAFDSFVMGPVQDWMTSLGRSKGDKAAAGVDSQVVNLATGALASLGDAAAGTSQTMSGQLIQSISSLVGQQIIQQVGTQAVTTSMAALAVSAHAAAAALAQLAAAGSGGGEEGASGLLGSLLNVGASFFGGFSSGSSTSSLISGTDSFLNGIGTIGLPGRATGGPVSAGHMYRVNEPGVQDYFIPQVNGYMANQPPGGGGIVQIDARTSIDARGATKDTVAELRREMALRDAQLRTELPYHIDARTRDNRQRLRQ